MPWSLDKGDVRVTGKGRQIDSWWMRFTTYSHAPLRQSPQGENAGIKNANLNKYKAPSFTDNTHTTYYTSNR
eukprot:scaffold2663_cov122-Skeletonema_menzelii.AAC.4